MQLSLVESFNNVYSLHDIEVNLCNQLLMQ